MAKLMEMEQTDRNKIALYLFNSINPKQIILKVIKIDISFKNYMI